MINQPITRVLKTAILPPGEPIFSERATIIEIDDEAAGEFVVIERDTQKIEIEPDQWPMIRAAIDAAFEEIAKHEKP